MKDILQMLTPSWMTLCTRALLGVSWYFYVSTVQYFIFVGSMKEHPTDVNSLLDDCLQELHLELVGIFIFQVCNISFLWGT
jgi:hypothetical protein